MCRLDFKQDWGEKEKKVKNFRAATGDPHLSCCGQALLRSCKCLANLETRNSSVHSLLLYFWPQRSVSCEEFLHGFGTCYWINKNVQVSVFALCIFKLLEVLQRTLCMVYYLLGKAICSATACSTCLRRRRCFTAFTYFCCRASLKFSLLTSWFDTTELVPNIGEVWV